MEKSFFIRTSLLFTLIFISNSLLAQNPAIQWQNTIGGTSVERLNSICITSDGGVALGGFSISNSSADKTENAFLDSMGFRTSDYWFVKLNAQGFIEFDNTIGGDAEDELYAIAQTADGGYILAGSSNSNNSTDKSENAYLDTSGVRTKDYWIVKLDSLGTIEWENTIGGNKVDIAHCVLQTNDGGYMIGGYSASDSSADKSENAFNNFGLITTDYWVVKLDASGNIEWENTIGGTADEVLHAIKQTADSGYILGGYSNSNASGDKTENAKGGDDYWIVKLDSVGNITWQKTIGGNSQDQLKDLIISKDGGYVFAGISFSQMSGDKTEAPLGFADYWVLKINNIGEILWQNTIGGSDMDYPETIFQAENGNYIIAGVSQSGRSGDKTSEKSGTNDAWFVNLDSLGFLLDQSTIGGSKVEFLFSIRQTPQGNLFLGCSSSSDISGDKNENSIGSQDYWVLKLTNGSNMITGRVYVDANLNGVYDLGEMGYNNGVIESSQSGEFNYAGVNANGIYFNSADSGKWFTSFLYDSIANLSVFPSVDSSNFFKSSLGTDTVNFALEYLPGPPDLCISIIPLRPARPGFSVSYRIVATNVGTDTISGDVVFSYDANLTFISCIPPFSTHNNSDLTWNFTAFLPGQINTYDITFNVPPPPTINIGDILSSAVVINPTATDANPNNNFDNIRHEVIGSWDPNDKWVSDEIIFDTSLPYNDNLDYLIRFQNTGNDTAFRVVIRDTLDALLEISTMRVLHASHDYLVVNRPGNAIEFQFNNILLPDSNVNEPASNGYVAFQIKPKSTLGLGDIIRNRADIYFDYNPPVLTNVVTTEVVFFTDNPGLNNRIPLYVYPNPTNGKLTISAKGLSWENATIKLYNTLGQLVKQEKVNLPHVLEHTIEVSAFKTGVYELVVTEGEKAYSSKVLVE